MEDGEIKVIDCPTKEIWVDITTKPLQGMVFRLMRMELMNCPVNYEDPMEEEDPSIKQHSIPAPRTVTRKSVIATTSKTPRECVGQNRNQHTMTDKERHRGRTNFPCRNQQRTIGVARLATNTWHPGVRNHRIIRQ